MTEIELLQQRIEKLEAIINAFVLSDKYEFKKLVRLWDGADFVVGTGTGTKIGTATTQKIGFYNTTPIIQPTTAGTNGVFVQNTGNAVNDASTFDGYKLVRVVRALKELGILA